MAWSLLPLALIALVVAMHALGARLLGDGRPFRDRVVATALLVPGAMIAIVHALSLVHAIHRPGMALLTAAVALSGWALAGRAARGTVWRDVRALGFVGAAWPWSLPATAAVGLATWAAAYLAPWAWDALGYHLPVVYDALQVHRMREIPCSVLFVNAYPHAGECLTLWWRALLPDDRWIDLVQLAAGLAGVAAIAALATRGGVPRARALGLATLWLALPAVALQLAADYVDVMYASALLLTVYFAVEPTRGPDVVLAALGASLVLALKPSGPPAVVIMGITLLVRARPHRIGWGTWAIALVVLALGTETYLRNLWIHHNPVWPVSVGLGPLHLPGLAPAREYIDIGVPPRVRAMGWLGRLVASWTAHPTEFIYDQRLGGFFPLGPCLLLPLAAVAAGLRRGASVRLAAGVVIACALAQPGAFHPRYTLVLPGALLLLTIVGTSGIRPRLRPWVDAVLVAVALFGVWHARGGFTDNRVPLARLPSMSLPARLAQVGVDNHGDAWWAARGSVHEGHAFAYDESFELPGLLYRDDGAIRVEYLPSSVTGADAFASWLQQAQVDAMVLSDEHVRRWLPLPSVRLTPRFRCPFDPCTVFTVRPDAGPTPRTDGVLVIAPHPDDEVLIAGGVLARAVAEGRAADVVVMTNGDFTCERDGYLREDETVAALALLGVPEYAVHFLGYPDGYLRDLGTRPLPPIARRDAHGACVRATGTYAHRGAEGTDEHTARTGASGAYTADAVVEDLAALLARLRPHEVYVTHPMDTHPDHAATYAFLRRALEHGPPPTRLTVHRAIVHAGACWPNGSGHAEPCPRVVLAPGSTMPPLPAPFDTYTPREHVPLPAALLPDDGEPTNAVKYQAIASYRSQTGPDPAHDWLATFARGEEVFYPEVLAPDPLWPGQVARLRTVPGGTSLADGIIEAPAACRLDVSGGASTSLTLEAGDATLTFTLRNGTSVELTRGLGDDPLRLGRADLPDEGDPARVHTYTLVLDARPDDGGVTEITVRRDGALLMVGIDPHPAARWLPRGWSCGPWW